MSVHQVMDVVMIVQGLILQMSAVAEQGTHWLIMDSIVMVGISDNNKTFEV